MFHRRMSRDIWGRRWDGVVDGGDGGADIFKGFFLWVGMMLGSLLWNYDNEDDENENMMDEMKMKMNENMNGKMMETWNGN